MRIITISREFGSGGRELGKRMADILQIAYYDKEIVSAIALKNQMDERYVSDMLEKGLSRALPITVGRTFSFSPYTQDNTTKILVENQRVLKELAVQGNCIFMGQSADIILQDYHPFNIFVYADLPAKIARCKERAVSGESFTENELKKRIKQVDTRRSKGYELLTNKKWGAKESYHLCVNTTGMDIKSLAPQIAEYAKYWLDKEKS